MARGGPDEPFRFAPSGEGGCDHAPGDYAETVRKAKERFRAGDLFETVPGVDTRRPVAEPPSVVFRRLMRANPAPYGFFINLGRQEYLVGASPEMFVRVEGRRVETCPISGTIRRGADPIADAGQIRALLNSEKDESELTMCTDVDRNDKSRICEPGSVRVIGRRQIEMYSRLIHTVDHVEGTLRAGVRRAGRVPVAHLGGHGDRRAQEMGDAVHRGARALAQALVRRRGGGGVRQRQHEYRAHAADDPVPRRRRLGEGRRDAAPRVRPRRGGGRDRRQGVRLSRCDRRRCARRPGRGRRRRGGAGARRAAGRPRGLLRPHARRLFPPDRRRGRDAALRLRPRRAGRAPAGAGGAVSRPRRAPGFRGGRDGRRLRRARHSGVRRLPRPAGHRRAFRGQAPHPRHPGARQAVGDRGGGRGAVRGPAPALFGRPLPFDPCPPRRGARRAGGPRLDGGRGDDGAAPPHAAGLGGAVPPRIDPRPRSGQGPRPDPQRGRAGQGGGGGR